MSDPRVKALEAKLAALHAELARLPEVVPLDKLPEVEWHEQRLRTAVAATERELARLTETLTSARRSEPHPKPGEQESPTRHSPDFRSVVWFGTPYVFTANQAACVRILWEAWENGTPDVGGDCLLEAADVQETSRRVSLIFRDSPAWGTMIRPGRTKGSYRLQEPVTRRKTRP